MIAAGIDQGTTSSKAAVLSDDGSISFLPGRRHANAFPAPGRVEQDPCELLANVRGLVDDAVAAGARHLCLANQGETIVAWDLDSGEPLCPAIVWQDQRTGEAVEALKAAGHEEASRAISGLPLDPYFSASKFAWVLENVPEARARAAQGRLGLATSDAYFIHQLTGRYVTEPSTAGRTGLMNIRTCEWDARLCDLFGVPMEVLPPIATDAAALGRIETPAGPAELSVGLVDQVAALYGHGCRVAGDVKFTFGTGAFGLAITGVGATDIFGAIPAACWEDAQGRVFAADGGIYTAGAAIEWLQRIGMLADHAELDRLSGASAASRGVFFVPALAGLACPHWDRSATGMWIGLDSGTDRADMQKAVLEGIAFRTAEVLDVLGQSSGGASPLSIDGGLAASDYFTRFLATVCVRPIEMVEAVDLTSIGAAEMALARAAGEAIERPPRLALSRRRVEPDTAPVSEWRGRFTLARQRASGWRQ